MSPDGLPKFLSTVVKQSFVWNGHCPFPTLVPPLLPWSFHLLAVVAHLRFISDARPLPVVHHGPRLFLSSPWARTQSFIWHPLREAFPTPPAQRSLFCCIFSVMLELSALLFYAALSALPFRMNSPFRKQPSLFGLLLNPNTWETDERLSADLCWVDV